MAAKKTYDQFEKDMNKLREISLKLESGVMDLNESLKLYEEGIKLYRKLNTSLTEIQRKVEVLMDDGSLSEFDDSEE